MARMIPRFLSPEVKSRAERKVFAWFQDAPDTEGWVVLHSLGIASHRSLIYSEIDFLILAPQYGVFALEVKGGRVSRADGIWTFTDKYGNTHTKSRGPFEQALSGIYSVSDAIKKKYGPGSKLAKLFFTSAVMFPDIIFNLEGIDAHQWQVFDQRNGRDVKGFIHRLAMNTHKQWEEKYTSYYEDKIPDRKDIKELANFLRGDFDKAVSLASSIKSVEEELIQLTGEQTKCLDQLEDNPRCLIEGSAGTGKTLLAIEAAKKAALGGEQTAFFCFNQMLGSWIKDRFNQMDPALRPAYTGTFHDFIFEIADKAGMPITKPEDAGPAFWRTEMPLSALEALERMKLNYDRIIIDEAQDLITANYLEVFDALLRKGVDRGKWFIFGDFSQQAIFSDIPEGDMKAMLDERTAFVRFRLITNCRNTKPIAGEIMTITGFDKNSLYIKTEGPPVTFYEWKDREDEKAQLEALLDRFIKKETVSPGQITILAPVRREHSAAADLAVPVSDFTPRDRKTVTFSTIQAFKGLENSVIILTGINSYRRDSLMYVGMSRARSVLFVFESASARRERLKS